MRRQRIKDLSRAVGIINQGGWFFPSNPKSEEKARQVYLMAGREPDPNLIWKDRATFAEFQKTAESVGFKVVKMFKPLNR